MVELADTLDSKSSALTGVRVQVPLLAPAQRARDGFGSFNKITLVTGIKHITASLCDYLFDSSSENQYYCNAPKGTGHTAEAYGVDKTYEKRSISQK